MKREQRSLSLNFQTHGAALSSSVLPTIELATQTEKYEVRNGRLSRTVLASNDINAAMKFFVVGNDVSSVDANFVQ
jgi:hypothetical protein